MELVQTTTSSKKGKAVALILFLLAALLVAGVGTTFALYSKSETVTVTENGESHALVIGAEGARRG